MNGRDIVELCRRHTIFEWSPQSTADPIPVERAEGVYFWTPDDKRFIDFNSQLMCVNAGHGDPRILRAIHEQADTLAYANPFMATEVRARLGAKLAQITRHMLGAFAGRPGARRWRRVLSEDAHRPGAGVALVERALAEIVPMAAE